MMTPYLPRGNAARRGLGPAVRVTEACAADNPRFITHVGTTAGAPADSMATPPSHQARNDRDLLPGCWSPAATSRGLRCPGRSAATGADRRGRRTTSARHTPDRLGPVPGHLPCRVHASPLAADDSQPHERRAHDRVRAPGLPPLAVPRPG